MGYSAQALPLRTLLDEFSPGYIAAAVEIIQYHYSISLWHTYKHLCVAASHNSIEALIPPSSLIWGM